MPNTPAFVAQGMTAVCMPGLSPEEEAEFHQVLSSFGQVEVLPERLMDVIVSVTGSSPAYVYMMIEAMGDAAVSIGLSRDSAYRLAAQALIGSATMVRDTGKHPRRVEGRCLHARWYDNPGRPRFGGARFPQRIV